MKRVFVLLLAAWVLFLAGCVTENSLSQTDRDTENQMPTKDEYDAIAEAIRPVPELVLEAGGHRFYASFEDNSPAEAFRDKLSAGAIELELRDHGDFEKVGPLPWSLPRNDETIAARPGDLILCQGDQLSICYDRNTGSFTRLARIDSAAREALLDAFGSGDVRVKLWVEWSE